MVAPRTAAPILTFNAPTQPGPLPSSATVTPVGIWSAKACTSW